MRINVASSLGNYVQKKYNGGFVPTFIVFDSSGKEVWRQNGLVPSLSTILSLGLSDRVSN